MECHHVRLLGRPLPEIPITLCRELFPDIREGMAFPLPLGHPQSIETMAPTFTTRHASRIAAALLVLAVSAAAWTLWLDHSDATAGRLLNDSVTTTSELLCFGVVGAVLVSRRPDLPFGWILGFGALADIALVGIGVPSLMLAHDGRGGQLAVWGVGLGVLQWVPTALQGIINVRFPSGRPAGRLGRWLDRAICFGIPIGLIGNYLGDSVTTDLGQLGRPLSHRRFVDGTWVTPVANASLVVIPVVILLGVLAGLGVIVRYFKATDIERKQLQWRAAGVVASLVLFPLAVSGVVGGASGAAGALAPLVFVSTLAIPVLRYQLWAGDPLPRRRRLGPLVSRRTLIEAREEERRRLRRDLHDGLGPSLTGLRLTLDAAQAQFARDPQKALEHLGAAREASADVILELRGLVYGLRPPALDELGLAASVRMHLASLVEGSPLEVTLAADGQPSFPAAVEVAIYRTAVEAVTNVIRHSTARQCQVKVITSGPNVVLTVVDDGDVFDTWRAGVGLTSMRERAVELGGTFIASSGPTGFHIKATYPRK
jgi:signal transduction histidine kinase